MSVLAAAELDGQRLTDDEIFAFLRLLLPAGAETTYRSSSNLIFGLLTQPRPARRAARRPLADAAGDRGGAAVGAAAHDDRADRDARHGRRRRRRPGRRRGRHNMGSANHDEKHWERPEEFDILREQHQHLAFAFGPAHVPRDAPGAHGDPRRARAVFDRLPNLRLDPDADDAAHHRHDLPGAAGVAGALRLREETP